MTSQPPVPPSSSPAPSSSRFTSQGSTAQDLLASQTVGLVNLSDFRKRRAEALEQKDREASSLGRFTPGKSAESRSGTATPTGNGQGVTNPNDRPKKKRKPVIKGKLSFGIEEDEEQDSATNSKATSTTQTPQSTTPNRSAQPSPAPEKRRLGPNANVSVAPRALTKSALRTESETRETLRRDFLTMQEAVRATEIIIPFVFYDGTNIPGGVCKIKKGDHAWLFLDRARKVGAESGVNAAGEKGGGSRRDWARVGVDDLILVRGEVIIPHRYEIYHFLLNKVRGPDSTLLFDYAATATPKDSLKKSTLATGEEGEDEEEEDDEDTYNPLSNPSTSSSKAKSNGIVTPADRKTLEGGNDDPNFTKVVDRRWYERNKHIFPASVWEEYDPEKRIEGKVRTDAQGNAFFFS